MRSQLHHLVEHRSGTGTADAPAVTFKSTTLSYAECWAASAAVAAGLARRGVERGDRVALFLDKRIETVVGLLGVSAAGATFVPVNPLLRHQQVGYVLADCDVKVLITSAERYDLLRDELEQCKSLEHVVLVGAAPSAGQVAAASHYAVSLWTELVCEQPSPLERSGGIDTDVAAIFYTSGSTGRPKGVVLSHRNLLAGAESVSLYLGNTSDDVILAALPLSFDAGFSQLTTAFSVGAHVVLMNYLLPADVVRLCAEHEVTGLTCVPPLWIQLAGQTWPDEATRHLRYFANTGGRMPRSVLDRLRVTFPEARPFLMYGLTEAFRSTFLDPDEVDRRPDSIGKAIPNAEVLVLRPDGSECEPGEHGELVHRGALVSLGYWNDPERTAARFRPIPGRSGGVPMTEMAVWSGDAVVRDEEGFLYFVGRTDEMIKTSGYRVSPTEVEEVAYGTGLVRDAVAFGVADERLGQRIVLAVTPAAGIELESATLQAQMRRSLPLYMVPSELVVRTELPRSPNGKFDRVQLRAELTS